LAVRQSCDSLNARTTFHNHELTGRDDDRRTYANDVGRRIPCVGAIVRDAAGRILLVRRANEPGRGQWSIPGGRVEAGETDAGALVREVREETGLAVAVDGLAGVVERAGPGGVTYVIRDYLCTVTEGVARPGDDASEVAWVDTYGLADLELVPGLIDALTGWGVLRQEASRDRGNRAFDGEGSGRAVE
jgi:8-oxo-dGTP diphosphatase